MPESAGMCRTGATPGRREALRWNQLGSAAGLVGAPLDEKACTPHSCTQSG